MRKNLRLQATLTALVIALALATTLPGTTAQAKSKVAMNKTKVTVCTGKSYTLKMTGISKKVKWSTSDKNVVSITKKSGKKAEKVTIKGNKKGTATVTAKVKVGKKTKTFKCQVTVKGHKYGKVTYKWNKDYSKCTASKKCSRCGKTLKQTVKASSKTTTKATCTEAGTKKYTAKFTKYSFGTKTKKVSIKVKSHSVDSNKKISYKWNSGYSKCTATYYCKNGGEKQKESVKASKKTTPATKTSKGKVVYTATFKTKGLQAQTKKVTIPKLAYLTLNGKEVNQISVGYGKPVTVTMCNDTIEQVETSTSKTVCTIKNDNQMTISTKDKIASVENVTATIWTQNGQRVDCAVKVMFTPGEYNFGRIDFPYTGTTDDTIYFAYGNNQGFHPASDMEKYNQYVKTCNTKTDYDKAYTFYNEQKRRDGSQCDLLQKAQEIYGACGERADYKSKARIEWEALSYDVQENRYDGDFYKYVKDKYGDVGIAYHSAFGKGFADHITSNAQLNKIVSDWTKVSGEVPSWYYYTAFSDWAEWVGRDVGKYTHTAYDEATDKTYPYTPPALPDNFRD